MTGSEGRAEGRPSWPGRLPAYAGILYLAAWITGLAVWPSNLALNATSTEVAAAYRSQAGPAATQYLLVEGLAGVLLGVVLAAAVLSADGGRLVVRARPIAVLGIVAVAVSLTQCVLGLLLISAAQHGDIGQAGSLSALVTRLDGVKMLALAGAAAYLAAGHPGRGGPWWLRLAAGLAAITLLLSGCTYLLLANSAAWTVYLSGPLLLVWITATGLWLSAHDSGRRTRARAAAAS
jgi:hypothetical protein